MSRDARLGPPRSFGLISGRRWLSAPAGPRWRGSDDQSRALRPARMPGLPFSPPVRPVRPAGGFNLGAKVARPLHARSLPICALGCTQNRYHSLALVRPETGNGRRRPLAAHLCPRPPGRPLAPPTRARTERRSPRHTGPFAATVGAGRACPLARSAPSVAAQPGGRTPVALGLGQARGPSARAQMRSRRAADPKSSQPAETMAKPSQATQATSGAARCEIHRSSWRRASIYIHRGLTDEPAAGKFKFTCQHNWPTGLADTTGAQ